MGKLSHKVAVVTGASKGIGAEIARELAAEGASVVVNYASSRNVADKVVDDIAGAGGRAMAIQGDIAKAADVERLFSEAARRLGPIDILVNNAGVYAFSPIESLSEDEFHRHFNINVLGVLLAIREALKHFAINGGSVINIGSVVSRLAPPENALYVATKSAVDGITRSLAKELGPRNIRVNSINPGVVETEGTHAGGIIGSEFERQAAQQTPLGRIGQPADIAAVAVFLGSDDARWVTGETLFASGGL
ncbi:MAG TPA: glucose 1-dehydrogenase [Acetobacteraceae bacterium]|jgi:3-oxoacyl-[acyl-carrier protein] reductase|nr:glucose 1-dehydrogenase [Acetobacteraceae bacterium]